MTLVCCESCNWRGERVGIVFPCKMGDDRRKECSTSYIGWTLRWYYRDPLNPKFWIRSNLRKISPEFSYVHWQPEGEGDFLKERDFEL